MSSPFAQPSSGGDKFEPGDYNGALLLIYPKSYNPNETTKFGPSTSADVDVVVVDRQDPTTGQPVYKHNARVFGNLANSVRDSLGAVVLAQLGQGVNTKGNPPWILLDTRNDPGLRAQHEAAAAAPHAQYMAGQFKQANVPTPPPAAAQTGWNQLPAPETAAPVPPTGAATPTASPTASDPNIAFLITKGIDAAKVVQMDEATRAMVAATYQ